MAESIPFRVSTDGMPGLSPNQRQSPPRVCERMIRLVRDVLSNCRNAELRNELANLQDNLAPAARELDKWVLAYREYGTKPSHDAQGLDRLHNEILQGDQEIAAYLIKTVREYVDWCSEQLHACTKNRTSTTRALQEGFVREDLTKLVKTYDQLRDLLAANVKNTKWKNRNQTLKRKHAEAANINHQTQANRHADPYRLIRRQAQVVEIEDSDDSLPVIPETSQSTRSADPSASSGHYDRDAGCRKRAKRDRVLPSEPELASHAASSILRAMGRHPDLPPLNASLEGLLPQKLRKRDIPNRESLATVQQSIVKSAQQWWEENA